MKEDQRARKNFQRGREQLSFGAFFIVSSNRSISVLNVAEPSERETDKYDLLEYIFIDDPVSSFDENHLIELAVNLAALIKSSDFMKQTDQSSSSPHTTDFSTMSYAMSSKIDEWIPQLESKHHQKHGSVSHEKDPQLSHSRTTLVSYHLLSKVQLRKPYMPEIKRVFHFNFLRNILEKTSTFVGYQRW